MGVDKSFFAGAFLEILVSVRMKEKTDGNECKHCDRDYTMGIMYCPQCGRHTTVRRVMKEVFDSPPHMEEFCISNTWGDPETEIYSGGKRKCFKFISNYSESGIIEADECRIISDDSIEEAIAKFSSKHAKKIGELIEHYGEQNVSVRYGAFHIYL